jgi:parallel beta-helix repeat protein
MICLVTQAIAQIIHVPADKATIQAAIDSASNGDTIVVSENTYYENINFLGKAITVASQFILDGDTSHISKTIIDGSQCTNPDTASVVSLCSGEDTTSILMGFTITGGKGTVQVADGYNVKGGGGVNIMRSGGKIIHNIIRDNHVSKKIYILWGAGIFAWVRDYHTVVIRKNIIRDNSANGEEWVLGGGVGLFGGRILCEENKILDNYTYSSAESVRNHGAGLFWCGLDDTTHTIREVYIRKNLIKGNVNNGKAGGGGGVGLEAGWGRFFEVSNNIITENHCVGGWAGGIYMNGLGYITVCNNTIVNNEAITSEYGVNSVWLTPGCHVLAYNNIIWGADNDKEEFGFSDIKKSTIHLSHNILKGYSDPTYPITYQGNTFLQPVFMTDSTFEPDENSPAVGRGIDSLLIGTVWHVAPGTDMKGSSRPGDADPYVDIGAVESEYPRSMLHNADLAYLDLMRYHKLWPDFYKDTLYYILRVPDTTIVTPQLYIITADCSADIDINDADSIPSNDPADRTTTITVTADDGYTQRIYKVQFDYMSADASLNNLAISKGTMVPEFHPDSLVYTVCLPKDQITPPEVYFETNDSMATVNVEYAPNIQLQTPWPEYRPYRTTVITVTSEDGIYKTEYEIEHLIDKNVPFIRLTSDTVILNSSIEATSTEDGYICLVPVNTPKNTDSVMIHMMDSIGVEAQVAGYLPASDTGTYRLYAIDNCLNISTSVVVTILPNTGIIENMLSNIRLYPIPVDRILYIETSETISSVEFFNVLGVKVMDESKFEGWIDMGHLEQGLYFIRIRTNNAEVYTVKVVKR